MSRLKEKTAIVTGAANGIGLAIAELFAEHGAWVLIVDLDEAAGSESAVAQQERVCSQPVFDSSVTKLSRHYQTNACF